MQLVEGDAKASSNNNKSSKELKQASPTTTIFRFTLLIATALTCLVCLFLQQPAALSFIEISSSPASSQLVSTSQIQPPSSQSQSLEDQLEDADPITTTLSNIVFGIGAASHVLERRKEYIKSWWRPGETRGFIYVDRDVGDSSSWSSSDPSSLPEIRVSEDTSRFNYTFRNGKRSAIRISRIVSEMFRLELQNVHWFVLGDDDTVFFVDNLVEVLRKYDHRQFYYVGSSSENHIQNVRGFSSNMAYGGGGFAISYSLAEALSRMQDGCLERYHFLFGSDDRIQACMAELGVQLTREPGFHQLDVLGDASGILAAHPVAPLLSLHHLNIIHSLFPNLTQQQSIRHLMEAARVDPAGIVQHSICYDRVSDLSIEVSWGYLVQISRGLVPPRLLELPLRTFAGWYGERSELSLPFKTRALPADPCQRPVRFFMDSVNSSSSSADGGFASSVSKYTRNWMRNGCQSEDRCSKLRWILVTKEATDGSWYRAPRRQCCRIIASEDYALHLNVGICRRDEFAAIS